LAAQRHIATWAAKTEACPYATAVSYVISPAAMAALAPDPSRSPDRLYAR